MDMKIVHWILSVWAYGISVGSPAILNTDQDSPSQNVPFIVNGWEAQRGCWPWQASLGRRSGDHYYHVCGAVLITQNFVLTAAHCVQIGYQYAVRLGGHDLRLDDWEDSITVLRFVTHPQYSSASGLPNDIAVLHLSRPARFTSGVMPAYLPGGTDDFVGAECYISGWGKTDGTSVSISNTLQEVRIPVISHQECDGRMRNASNTPITDKQICLFDKVNPKSSCQGDSGGPLHCRRCTSDWWVVAGVTSWGLGSTSNTCYAQYPSVYTRTNSYIDWIQSVISDQLYINNNKSTCYHQSTAVVDTIQTTPHDVSSFNYTTPEGTVVQTTTPVVSPLHLNESHCPSRKTWSSGSTLLAAYPITIVTSTLSSILTLAKFRHE